MTTSTLEAKPTNGSTTKSLIQYLGITEFRPPATAAQIPSIFQKFFTFNPGRGRQDKNNEISGQSINLNRGNAAS
ncbi:MULTISPECIES: hypothetical protein [unclassified Microcoleus]|uniref:hypothetical protein n=1 Tax=unclassified Microcoleus TaxID=2642155 RepID=UPI002FCEE1F7